MPFKRKHPSVIEYLNLYPGDKGNIEQFLSWLSNRINGLTEDELQTSKAEFGDSEKEISQKLIDFFGNTIKEGYFVEFSQEVIDVYKEYILNGGEKGADRFLNYVIGERNLGNHQKYGVILEYVQKEKNAESLEESQILECEKLAKLINFYETSSLYETFIRRISNLRRETKDDNLDTVNIFTPNYDLFIENSLDTLGFSYIDGFNNHLKPNFSISEYNHRLVDTENLYRDRWSPIRPFFKIFKLHGSINWVHNKKDKKIINKVYGENNESVVILPTSSKYADTQGSPFSDLFRAFSVELLRPQSLLLVNGYSFGDEHINDLIIQSLGRSDFKMIAFVEEERAQSFMNNEGVRGNTRATFITNLNSEENTKDAHYFSTLTRLLEYWDPFGSEKISKNEELEEDDA
ncbi:MAG: SIR2 family protein [Streptococcaceae bacterium]|nr:SIR2 family protein [Streptococcaceae bacterium]